MTEKLAKRFSLYLVRIGVAEGKDRELLEYGIFHALSSTLHILYLLLAGLCFSCLLEIAAFSVFFCSLKRYIGGAHAGKHWMCLLTFTGSAWAGAMLGKALSALPGSLVVMVWLSGAALLAVIGKAPVVHPNSPYQKKAALAKFRKVAVLTSGFQLAAVCATCVPPLSFLRPCLICGSLGSATAALTLFLPVPNPERREGEK